METYIDGQIFSGIFDFESQSFTLECVKNISTESVMSRDQLNKLYHYLSKMQNSNEFIYITVNDQIPLKLSNEELTLLMGEIRAIFGHIT